MGKGWQKKRKKDYYYKKAKSENYRSRASFKLEQLNRKFKLMKRGDSVLDLGASPGGWMQVAAGMVGEKGVVVGVDLEAIAPFNKENVISIIGDITKKEALDRIREVSDTYDVVISDASPDISGAWDMDHFNSVDLARHALGIAKELLKEEGNLLIKVFQGSMLRELVSEFKREFEFTKISKPKASRQESSEVYLVGKGLLKTPVRAGDIVDLTIVGVGQMGDGVAFVDGFKVIVEGGKLEERLKVRIKKVSRGYASAVKV